MVDNVGEKLKKHYKYEIIKYWNTRRYRYSVMCAKFWYYWNIKKAEKKAARIMTELLSQQAMIGSVLKQSYKVRNMIVFVQRQAREYV